MAPVPGVEVVLNKRDVVGLLTAGCLLYPRIMYTVFAAQVIESLQPGSEVWKCPEVCFLTSQSFSFSFSKVRIRAPNSRDYCVAEIGQCEKGLADN